MPIPAALWYLAAAAAGAVMVRAIASPTRRGSSAQSGVTLRPQLLSFRPQVTTAANRQVQVSPWASEFSTGPQVVSFPPQIPASVLAAVAGKILYAGAYDNKLPAMKQLANSPASAEQQRASIVSAMWQGLAVGMDGFPKGRASWSQQLDRFNAAAIAIQNELQHYTAPPMSVYQAMPMMAPALSYPIRSIATLGAPAQWLCYRYLQLVQGVGCDLWDEIWTQGHTTREIYSLAPAAAGATPAQCRDIKLARYEWLFRRLERLRNDPSYTEPVFVDELAQRTLALCKDKIVIWPGGPASAPYVDWGWLIGALARMVGAAASGDVEQLAAIAEEAGDKSREWAARPPGDDYGSAELADDIAAYAGELASRS